MRDFIDEFLHDFKQTFTSKKVKRLLKEIDKLQNDVNLKASRIGTLTHEINTNKNFENLFNAKDKEYKKLKRQYNKLLKEVNND